jgi:hypothetical protein
VGGEEALMGNWVIDGHTLIDNPNDDVDIFRADLLVAYAPTYGGVQVAEWDPSIVGKRYDLTFTYMEAAEFDIIDASCKKTSIILDPQLDSGITFEIKPISFDGKYFRSTATSGVLRKEVKLSLLILAEIPAP